MIQRYKNRYVLVESSSPLVHTDGHAVQEIMGLITSEVGNVGFLEASPRIVHWPSDSTFILRVNRGHEREIILALSFIKSIGGKMHGFYTIKTSGTIRSLLDFCKKSYA